MSSVEKCAKNAFDMVLHIKLVANGPIHKIFHITDIEKVLGLIILMNIKTVFHSNKFL